MNKADVEKIEKAAEAACFDAMLEVHRIARKFGTTVVSEVGGVTVEKPPLSDEELASLQSTFIEAKNK